MKVKKLSKKLELNKATIVDLTIPELKKVKGGDCTLFANPVSCPPEDWPVTEWLINGCSVVKC